MPAKITAHVGDTVEWSNKDFVAHTETARSGEWDVALPVNGKGSVTLKKPGEISYYCRVHPNGKIKVTTK